MKEKIFAEYYLWFKWKDKSLNLKSSFLLNYLKKPANFFLFFCYKFCTVFEYIS